MLGFVVEQSVALVVRQVCVTQVVAQVVNRLVEYRRRVNARVGRLAVVGAGLALALALAPGAAFVGVVSGGVGVTAIRIGRLCVSSGRFDGGVRGRCQFPDSPSFELELESASPSRRASASTSSP